MINRLAVSESLDINHAMELVRSVALDLLFCEKVTLFLVFERRRELRWAGSCRNNSREHQETVHA